MDAIGQEDHEAAAAGHHPPILPRCHLAAAPAELRWTSGIARVCHRSLDGLVAALRHLCPSLSTGQVMWNFFSAGADLTAAIALANGTSKSSAVRVIASRGHDAFNVAADAARHPSPATFALFVSSVLPAVNRKHNVVQLLIMKNALATRHINYLSNV